MRTTLIRAALAATLLAGGALTAQPSTALSLPVKRETPPPAVVGVVDTGINPYHVTFRDGSKRARQYPGTYLPGYPKGAIALNLSLGEKDYWKAVRKDCAQWKKVQPGRLYWVPGTKIVGAVSFVAAGQVDCAAEKPTGMPILDTNGHGTMTASRVASWEYGACRSCLVVATQMPSSVNIVGPAGSEDGPIEAIRWVARNSSWIDAQSNSWGPIVPGYDPTRQAGLLVTNPEMAKAAEEVSKAHLAFWASGNGAAFRGGVLGHPTLAAPHLGPSGIIVGGHDSGQVATWPGFTPHVVSDACASWAAKINTMGESGDSVGSGTSAATPYVAGGAAQILQDARGILGDTRSGVRSGGVVASGRKGAVPSGPLADGVFTLDEWRTVTLKTATARPVKQREDGPTCGYGNYGPTPVQWTQVPAGFPEFTLIGYGAVDGPSVRLAYQVLRGAAPLPDRATTDQYFTVDRRFRETAYQVYTTP